MNSQLIEKATELRNKGLTTGEIADELNISKDTTQWLIMQMTSVKAKSKSKPDDFAINWKTIGASSARIKFISEALVDLTLEYDVDAIVGISVSGIPFATIMADILGSELSVFHPIKHMKNESAENGTLSNNFTNIKNKNVVIVDDVITSGRTISDAIETCKNHGANPVSVTVLVDKKGIKEVNDVPIQSLIKINKVG
ncbi:MAG: orotate phosphoribosyltransferase-like protein [Methanosphaera stadtmanae]|nr:orotate phosphoribosyltransferase-like protein [Methanosphaera stadtmanae]